MSIEHMPDFWVGEEIESGRLWLYDPEENCPFDLDHDSEKVDLFEYHATNPRDAKLLRLDRADQRRKVRTVKDADVRIRVISCYLKWREYQGFSYSAVSTSTGELDMGWAFGGVRASHYKVQPIFYSDS